MKRSPLRRRPKEKRGKYARRPRAPESWFEFVKSLPCVVARFGLPGQDGKSVVFFSSCAGAIEANHVGVRIGGLGTKSRDCDCAPFCREHHRQWTEYSGVFAGWTHGDRREYAAKIVERVHELACQRSVEVPDA